MNFRDAIFRDKNNHILNPYGTNFLIKGYLNRMITLKRYSGITVLECEQTINAEISTVWDFFSSPSNLGKITPPEMNFRITGTDTERKSYPGQIISYTLNPFKYLRVNWITEITHLEEYRSFVDEQRFGPYRFWHHRHFFKAEGGKTIMNDIVTFRFPGGIIGRISGRLFVEPRVLNIFSYRLQKIDTIFTKNQN